MGEMLRTGVYPTDRVVSLGGPLVRSPRLVTLPMGADIEALARTEASDGPRAVLSGSPLAGRESRFLRRRHDQVTLMPRISDQSGKRRRFNLGPVKRAPLVPHAALARALGPDRPSIPLLRALSVGDTEAALRLGVLGLVEEDMALATYLSGGTEDFAARLRDVLDQIEAEAA